MITGRKAYGGALAKVELSIRTRLPNFAIDASTDCISLLKEFFKRQPEARLGGRGRDAEGVKEHVFFSQISWNEMLARRVKPPSAT